MAKIKSVRCPDELLDAAGLRMQRLGISDFGEYVRRLIAADCGVAVPTMGTGMAGASEQTRKRVSKAGVKAAKAKRKS